MACVRWKILLPGLPGRAQQQGMCVSTQSVLTSFGKDNGWVEERNPNPELWSGCGMRAAVG